MGKAGRSRNVLDCATGVERFWSYEEVMTVDRAVWDRLLRERLENKSDRDEGFAVTESRLGKPE